MAAQLLYFMTQSEVLRYLIFNAFEKLVTFKTLTH